MKKSNSFVLNTAFTVGRQVFGILVGLLTTIIIARYLGPNGQGSFNLLILLPTLLMTLLNFGIAASSAYYVGKEEFQLGTVYKTNIVLGLIFSLAAIVVGIIVVSFLYQQFFVGVPKSLLIVMLLVLPASFLSVFLQGIFHGKQDFKEYNSTILITQTSTLIVSSISIVVFGLGLSGALLGFIAGQLITLARIFYLLRKNYGFSFREGTFSKSYAKKALTFGGKAHISNVMAFLNYRADVMIISYFINPAAVGLYMAAVNIAERLWIFSQAISTVLFPKIVSLKVEEEKNRVTSLVSRNVFVLSIMAGIIFYLLADFLIVLLFGDAYRESVLALKLLLPGVVLGSVGRILSNDISGRGKPEINMYVSFFTVSLNIILNIILVPKQGFVGSAIATSITYFLNFVIKVVIFHKLTGLTIAAFIIPKVEDLQLYLKVLNKFGLRAK